jgi:hypothetical protein
MQRLNNRDALPPDFFRFTHAETGYRSEGRDWWAWQEDIKKHREANNLAPVTPEQSEDQICRQLPPGWCSHSENERPWVETRLSLGDVLRGTSAYLKLVFTGTVSKEEANRRARICAGCYLLVSPQGCGACSELAKVVIGDVAGKSTDYDDRLNRNACAACQCPVRSLVHFPISILEQADPNDEKQSAFAPFCWRLKGGENYLPAAA